jgi:hypothetical protein
MNCLGNFLTPLIAIIAAWIAYQQFQTNQLKLKFDMFDKRLKVYQALMDFIGFVINYPDMKIEEVKKFDVARSESVFLFGKDIREYLQSIRDQAAALTILNSQIQELASNERIPERTQSVNEKLEKIDWFYKQIEVAQGKFSRYLTFES